MADLVERLRAGVPATGMHEDNSTELFDVVGAAETMAEAADRIERLEAALRPFAFMGEEYDDLGDEVRLESINLATGEHLGGIPVSAFRRARGALAGDPS